MVLANMERKNLHCHHVDGQQSTFAKNIGQGHEFGSYITLVDKQIIIFCALLKSICKAKIFMKHVTSFVLDNFVLCNV
jgi:hypothetical protein